MYNDIYSDDLVINEDESFDDVQFSRDSIFVSLYDQIMSEQEKKKKEERVKKERKTKTDSSNFFFMKFESEADRIRYCIASDEERKAIRQKQMQERGLIQKAEEVVETVKEVSTKAVSAMKVRMIFIKSMKEKKSYSYVTYNSSKVLENTLDAAFNKAKEISAMVTNRIALAADNTTFNRSMFPNTS